MIGEGTFIFGYVPILGAGGHFFRGEWLLRFLMTILNKGTVHNHVDHYQLMLVS